jgi:hypothetical protein
MLSCSHANTARRPGSYPISAGEALSAERIACRIAGEPTVSVTRCTRCDGAGFKTLCRRKVSNTQLSPAAMWTLSSPHRNITSGVVMIGTWTRTRSNQ